MASAMRKMAVYLGLVEDDHRYQDKYDSYGEYEDYDDQADRPEQIDEPDVRGAGRDGEVGGGYAGYQPADWRTEHVSQTTDLARITTLHPRTYNEARTIGEHFREGTPVIMGRRTARTASSPSRTRRRSPRVPAAPRRHTRGT